MPFVPISPRPAQWFVCFVHRSPLWWIQMFVPGRYKHVRCFGWEPSQRLWFFYNYILEGTDFGIVPDGMEAPYIAEWIEDSLVVEYLPASTRDRKAWQPIAVCASQVAQIVGSNSRALRPGKFLTDLLADGGKIVVSPESATAQANRTPRTADKAP